MLLEFSKQLNSLVAKNGEVDDLPLGGGGGGMLACSHDLSLELCGVLPLSRFRFKQSRIARIFVADLVSCLDNFPEFLLGLWFFLGTICCPLCQGYRIGLLRLECGSFLEL